MDIEHFLINFFMWRNLLSGVNQIFAMYKSSSLGLFTISSHSDAFFFFSKTRVSLCVLSLTLKFNVYVDRFRPKENGFFFTIYPLQDLWLACDIWPNVYLAAGIKSVCDGYVCAYGAKCVVHRGRPTCECRQCTEEYEPVSNMIQ